ncbi:hypothetical protein PHYSODRAFT_487456, partial [Phytophthora sojae]
LEHFQRKFAATAVPFGVSSLDENGVRTKARSAAKFFMPLKPDKFAIRFYAVVGWGSLYVHSLWDNGSGNKLPTTPAQRYTRLFPRMRTPVDNTLRRADVRIKSDATGALWMAMIAHQTKLFPAPSQRRLLVCDNFYTRHDLANAVLALTNGEVRMLGTIRRDWVGRLNKAAVRLSMSLLTWALDMSIINAFALMKQVAPESQTRPKPFVSSSGGYVNLSLNHTAVRENGNALHQNGQDAFRLPTWWSKIRHFIL